MTPVRGAVGGTLLLAAALAAALGGAPRPSAAQAPDLALRDVGNFTQPVHVAHAPRRPALLYVVEQPGTIRVLRRGRKLARPFVDLRSRVRTAGNEEGLLSVAFHPRFPRNRSFFVYYVNRAGDIQVDRLRARRGRPARALPGSRVRVIRIPHPTHQNHNGGQLAFGPNGLLHLATGDGGGAGDPRGNAQNRRSLLGKLLRIRPLARGGHRSPRTNPYVGRPGRNQILARGLRNPWRFSFDRATGDLWIADVGQSSWEEVNHVSRAAARGANFGWSCREGPDPFAGAAPACAERGGFTDPVHAYPTHAGGACAITGGHVARGRGAPAALRGRYVYGDHCNGQIRSLDAANPTDDRPTGLPAVGRLSSFGEGRRGRVYVASRSGAVRRIVSG